MIPRYRRYWALPAALLLLLPLVFTLVAPPQQALSAEELRALAPAPSRPHTWHDLLGLPPQTDAWLHDHFGLRSIFIHAHALLTQGVLRSGNGSVLMGRDGGMFYRLDNMLQQSAGLIRRDQLVTETANLLAQMKDVLDARGIRLLVASPPNASTIYGDRLPRWAQNQGAPTEQDLLLAALSARGVAAVDLRPVLRAARAEGKVYSLHDTHWTARGAIAGFNAVAAAASHADWRLDTASVQGAPVTITGGDLARMIGINNDVTETTQLLALPAGHRETFSPEPFPTYAATLDHPGPTVLVIGDSFTGGLFWPMVVQHAGRFAWTHHLSCGFSWKWIEQFQPDEVWWMPTERFILCQPGARPLGFPEQMVGHP